MRIPSFEECPRQGLAILGGAAYPSLAFFSTVERMTTALVSQSSHGTRKLFFHPPLLRSTSAGSQKGGLGFQWGLPSWMLTSPKPLPLPSLCLVRCLTSLTRQGPSAFLWRSPSSSRAGFAPVHGS